MTATHNAPYMNITSPTMHWRYTGYNKSHNALGPHMYITSPIMDCDHTGLPLSLDTSSLQFTNWVTLDPAVVVSDILVNG